ncbi:MAG: N-acetyltransferase [Mogibacterium sp.]|nr:N-acetyltransferase [Mogibacterium sp.]
MIEIRFEKEALRAAAYDVQDSASVLVGTCTYEPDGPDWAIMHTNVDPAYGGQGIAGRLVAAVVDAARAEGVKVVPVCSYAVRQFEKHAEYRDVLR